MSRAKSKMGISEDESVAAEAVELEWVSRFLTSLEQGNINQLLSLLTEDVLLVSDGGGKVLAFTRPIQMRNQVARILAGAIEGIKPYYQGSLQAVLAPLNGETGILLLSGDKTVAAILLQCRDGKLSEIYIVLNPEKLTRV